MKYPLVALESIFYEDVFYVTEHRNGLNIFKFILDTEEQVRGSKLQGLLCSDFVQMYDHYCYYQALTVSVRAERGNYVVVSWRNRKADDMGKVF